MARQSAQIITFEGEYNHDSKEFLQNSNLEGTDYHTVSIIGCQSTGKSTLLNMLFGTTFDTLDALQGRNQTTKGIHLSCNPNYKTVVIDIEGTDSQVRGDDGAAFEHMSALFALAVSEVLMVNMWTSEIGRYKAASVGLLKTIFEVNLKLFNQDAKKRILFVLRDFNSESNNLPKLKQQISATMEDLWGKIKKPSSHALLTVFDCFEFEFMTIAVKDFKPEEFKSDVDELRNRFTDPERMDFLFRNKETDVPVDGLSLYLSEIWNVIQSDKDINIPSQKEMLSTLRCNELKAEALQSFTESSAELKKKAGKELIGDFASQFQDKIKASLEQYDEHGKEYLESVYESTKDELLSLMLDQIKDLFYGQMRLLVQNCSEKFKAQVNKKLPKDLAVENFQSLLSESINEVNQEFLKVTKNTIIEQSNWDAAEFEEQLEKLLSEKIDSEKEKQMTLLNKEIERNFSGKFSTAFNKILQNGHDCSMWENIHNLQLETMEPLEQRIQKVLKGHGCDHSQIDKAVSQARKKFVESVKTKMRKFVNNITDHLTKRFNLLFLKDERGIPRDWKNTNIEEVYTEAKETTMLMLDNFRHFNLSLDWEDSDIIIDHEEIVSESEYELVKDNFLKNAEMAYKDAVQLKEYGFAMNGMPKWYLILLLILGWNEFMWVLKSPFIMYPLLLIASVVALMFSMGMGAVPKLFFRLFWDKLSLFDFLR